LVRLCNEIGTHRPTVEHDDAMPQQRELATMVAAMNQLRAQARAQRQHEWTFLADSAHALRAPLAAINAQAYALAGANSLADRQAALRAIESGVARSADMLDKLLALAQLDGSDPSTIRSEPAPLNVCAMVREVLAAHTPRALASGHALGASAAQTVWAMAEQSSLRLALDNLVDNAIRHTERGCRIEVSVTANQEQVCILVEDSGPGIADTERERLLGPVVRPGHSRQRQGIGLGLAIVVAAMRRCRGSVTLAASASLGGAKFSLQLAAGPSTISVEKK
jgi:signal transduction histidine kinase